MRQHILETVNVIVQKRSLKGEPYLWQNGYILNIKKRKRCFRFGCCYICRLHKKVLPLNAILKWYSAESHICVILMPLSRSVKTCFWGLISFSEWIDLWLIAVKRESWLKDQDLENQNWELNFPIKMTWESLIMLRDGCPHQNGWIFWKVSDSLWPSPVPLVNCPTQPTCIAHCDLCNKSTMKIWRKYSRASSYSPPSFSENHIVIFLGHWFLRHIDPPAV